jgi:uncharacterized protein YqgC (DUF456 family)
MASLLAAMQFCHATLYFGYAGVASGEERMAYLWAVVLIVLNTVWLGLVLLGLPGIWLMVITAAVVAWWQYGEGTPMFGVATLAIIVALAVVGEIVESAAGAAGSRGAGGTRRGTVGALVGGLAGAIVGTVLLPMPLLGSLIGASVGAGLGALGLELTGGRAMRNSVRTGLGAGAGRLLGTVLKLMVAVAVWVVLAVAAFWP